MQTTTDQPQTTEAPPPRGPFAEVPDGAGGAFKVYPLGICQMDRHKGEISSLIAAALGLLEKMKAAAASPDQAGALFAVLMPLAGGAIMRLSASCTVPNPYTVNATADVTFQIARKWFELTFMPIDVKLKNVLSLVDAVTMAAAGQKLQLWLKVLASWSPTGTAAPTSTTAPATTAPPTSVGVGPSISNSSTPRGASAPPASVGSST